jgi:RecB family endonuclease NucS
VSAIKAHVSMGTYREDAEVVAAIEAEHEVAEAFDAAFGLERDLQLELRRSIEQLEPGLTVIDGDREQTVASGRIDITARDQDGITVVIELKAGTADRDAIGQILSYMGDLTTGTTHLRGIIVAREFSTRAVAAARAAPNIQLLRYGIRFSFDTVRTALS